MGVVSPLPEGGHVVMGLKHLWYEKVESGQVIENLQSICVNAAYVCAAGVGAVAVAYGAARGMKFLTGGVKCLAAASLAGSLIFGGMVVTSVHVAGAKTNDTQQVGGDTNQIENGKWRMENAGGRTTILRSPFSILHSFDMAAWMNELVGGKFTLAVQATNG